MYVVAENNTASLAVAVRRKMCGKLVRKEKKRGPEGEQKEQNGRGKARTGVEQSCHGMKALVKKSVRTD
jgi:hypothetical protein